MKNHGLRAAALALAVLAAAPCAAQAGWRSRMHWRGGSWLMHAGDAGAGSLPAGAGANWVTFDPSTRTLYVPNFFDDTITVVSADRGAPVATIPTGKGPGALALDPRTRTLYGVNLDDGTVSAYDAGACNARVVTACGGARATASVGGVPIGLAVDEATDTVYVTGDGADTMALLDGATCGRAGCAVVAHVPTGPVALPFADPATRTIYVPGAGDDADQVLVVDARRCNARATSGCGGPFPKATVGHGGATGGVDPSTRTVYVANAD